MKKFLSLALTLVGIFSFMVTPAHAATIQNVEHANEEHAIVCTEATIGPRAAICGNCGVGSMSVISTSYGNWYVSNERKCPHYPYGTDLEKSRAITTTTRCNYCSYGYSSIKTESKWECHGYSR